MRSALTFETPTDGVALVRLRPLAERIFEGDRSRGWWARKLRREGARPSLCVVARDTSGAPVGYGLAGQPSGPSGPARAVTMGVVPEARGQGLGTALWSELLARARAAGSPGFELASEPKSVSFYERLGFSAEGSFSTWVHGGDPTLRVIPRVVFGASSSWDVRGTVVCEWLERAWRETPREQRARLDSHDVSALISREPAGLLVQRFGLTGDPGSALRALTTLEPTAPLFLYGVEEATPRTDALRECLRAHGFFRGQSFFRMVCPLTAGT